MDSCKETRMEGQVPLSQGKGNYGVTHIFILKMNQIFVPDQ